MNISLPKSALIPASDYVIFGGTGDLATRKILPALFWRFLDGQINEKFAIYICSRKEIQIEDLELRISKQGLGIKKENKVSWEKFKRIIKLTKLDVSNGAGAEVLKEELNKNASSSRPIIFYLALSSDLFSRVCEVLKNQDLNLPQSRIVIEKPLGKDRKTAKEINNEIGRYFNESQIYRIDHYLGKETVQNLMALRFANVIFENQWNNKHIDNVQITVAETVGVEGRGSYYDSYGAIKDMLQNHLLQLLCLIAMEPPANFNAEEVRDEKLRVLKALAPPNKDDFIIGQYKGYAKEVGRRTNTETYIATKVLINNWRWAEVPFYLRTGKKLSVRASEIVITFKDRLHDIFSKDRKNVDDRHPNRLIIRVQPDEGLRLQLRSKEPGPGGMRLFPSELNLSFGETFQSRLPDAYERLLIDTARGNQTLFMRFDEVLAAWNYIDKLVSFLSIEKLKKYDQGSMGPADTILEKSGHEWFGIY